VVEHQVGRLHVAVDHTLAVGVGQGVSGGAHNAQGLGQRQPIVGLAQLKEAIFEGWAFDQLHDHVVAFVNLIVLEVVDLDDAGML